MLSASCAGQKQAAHVRLSCANLHALTRLSRKFQYGNQILAVPDQRAD